VAVKDEAGDPPAGEEEEDGEMDEGAVTSVEAGEAMRHWICIPVAGGRERRGGAALGVDDFEIDLLSGEATVHGVVILRACIWDQVSVVSGARGVVRIVVTASFGKGIVMDMGVVVLVGDVEGSVAISHDMVLRGIVVVRHALPGGRVLVRV